VTDDQVIQAYRAFEETRRRTADAVAVVRADRTDFLLEELLVLAAAALDRGDDFVELEACDYVLVTRLALAHAGRLAPYSNSDRFKFGYVNGYFELRIKGFPYQPLLD